MTFAEFQRIAILLDSLWQLPGAFDETHERAYYAALSAYDVDDVEQLVLAASRQRGQRFRPIPADLIPDSMSTARKQKEYARTFRAASVIYGKELARQLLDPHGLRAEWEPTAPGHDKELWGGTRKKLLSLNAMGTQTNTTNQGA